MGRILQLLFLTVVSRSVGSSDSGPTLYLLALAPFPSESGGPAPQYDAGPALIPAVKLAVEHINEQSDILKNYTLDYVVDRSGCQLTETTLVSFTRHIIHSEKQFMGIIGPACSESTLTVGALATQNRANVVQIAPSAVSPLLDDPSFNNTFQVLGSAAECIDVWMGLMRARGWTRVGILYEDTRIFFPSIFDAFRKRIPEEQLVFSAGFNSQRRIPLQEIKASQLRIVFVLASDSLSRQLLCLAFRMGFVYPTYQWIFYNRELPNLLQSTTFTYDNQEWNCSEYDMENATEGIVLNLYRLARRDDMITVANRTYAQYRQQYLNETGSDISGLETELEYSNVYYDSVWALALSLNSSIPFLKERLSTSQKEPTASVIRQKLLEVDFEGMSGAIKFDNTTRASDRTIIDAFLITRNDSSGKHLIGFYDPTVAEMEILNDSGLINDAFNSRLNHIGLGVGIFLLLVSVAMILFIFILHLVNVIYKDESSLKANSPHLNHLIFSGCYILCILAIVVVLAEIFVPSMQNLNRATLVFYGVHCGVLSWCATMSYTLILGAVCAKQWRIYRIFFTFSNNLGSFLTDSSLIGLVCVLLLLDVIFNVIWNAVDPWMVFLSETFTGDAVIVQLTCRAEHLLTWITSAFIKKGIVTLPAVSLAYLNRHVPRKAFRETKSINAFAYASTTISTIGAVNYIILLRQQSIWSFLVLCVMVFLNVLLCVFLFFLPPIIPLMKQKFFQR